MVVSAYPYEDALVKVIKYPKILIPRVISLSVSLTYAQSGHEHKLTLARTPVAIAKVKEVDFILPLDSDLLSIRFPREKMALLSLVPLKCRTMHSRTSSDDEYQNLMRGPFHSTEKRFTF